jgi:hypothetical protein
MGFTCNAGLTREWRSWKQTLGEAVWRFVQLETFHCLSRNGGEIWARDEQTLSRHVPAIAATFGRP